MSETTKKVKEEQESPETAGYSGKDAEPYAERRMPDKAELEAMGDAKRREVFLRFVNGKNGDGKKPAAETGEKTAKKSTDDGDTESTENGEKHKAPAAQREGEAATASEPEGNSFTALREGMAEEDAERVRDALEADGRLPGFRLKLGAMEKIIARVPALQAMPAADRYTLAYLVSRGLDSGKAPTAKQTVDALLAQPEAVRLYEIMRAANISGSGSATPPHRAVRGTAAMPANLRPAPKSLEDARREAYGFFGING